MASTQVCLWCRNTLLRHVRRSGVYWFCNSCRQEIHPRLVDLGQAQPLDATTPDPSDLMDADVPLQGVPVFSASAELAALPRLETRPVPGSSVVE